MGRLPLKMQLMPSFCCQLYAKLRGWQVPQGRRGSHSVHSFLTSSNKKIVTGPIMIAKRSWRCRVSNDAKRSLGCETTVFKSTCSRTFIATKIAPRTGTFCCHPLIAPLFGFPMAKLSTRRQLAVWCINWLARLHYIWASQESAELVVTRSYIFKLSRFAQATQFWLKATSAASTVLLYRQFAVMTSRLITGCQARGRIDLPSKPWCQGLTMNCCLGAINIWSLPITSISLPSIPIMCIANWKFPNQSKTFISSISFLVYNSASRSGPRVQCTHVLPFVAHIWWWQHNVAWCTGAAF